MKRHLLIVLFFTICSSSFAQLCVTPEATLNENNQKKKFLNFLDKHILTKSEERLIIPIVFHVIDNGGEAGEVDLARANTMVDYLNQAYNKQNTEGKFDYRKVDDRFTSLIADMNIEFRLATKKPDGSSFNGLTKTNYTGKIYKDHRVQNTFVRAVKNEHGFFNEANYLNVFVTPPFPGNTVGFAYLPYQGKRTMARAVYMNHSYIDGGGNPFALAHEVGHWLSLFHTFEGNCSSTNTGDYVEDTPQAELRYYQCSPYTNCQGEYVNYENFMDYNVDCFRMFTSGQKKQVRGAIEFTDYNLKNVVSNDNLSQTGVLEVAAVSTSNQEKFSLEVYPNPSNQQFNIKYMLVQGMDFNLIIQDQVGRTVYSEHQKKFKGQQFTTVDIKQWPKGMYFLRVHFNDKTIYKKLIKQ